MYINIKLLFLISMFDSILINHLAISIHFNILYIKYIGVEFYSINSIYLFFIHYIYIHNDNSKHINKRI